MTTKEVVPSRSKVLTETFASSESIGSRIPVLSRRNGCLCALVVVACVLITYPVANMPFSDGFSYEKTALEFARTGRILYNGWATAMLGWLIPWGALFIKVFGFSFTGMRLSMLPIDAVTVYLFHNLLQRFGINRTNAILGTFALALSPIFMPAAASFMSDVPGLLAILICIFMCLKAVNAETRNAALRWIVFASLFNVAAGTVRQIAWLGALVMVPSTVWLLRKRRGVLWAGAATWFCSLIGILALLSWFNRQPYSVPEHIIWASVTPGVFVHLAAQVAKTLFCLSLVLLPITCAWLPTARRLPRKSWIRIGSVLSILVALAIVAVKFDRIDTWLMPWLNFLLTEQTSLQPGMFGTPDVMILWIRAAVSFVTIGVALVLLEQLRAGRLIDRLSTSTDTALPWKQIGWILGPYTAAYALLLMPRGAFDQIQDRYLIGIVPIAIIVLLRIYQERIGARLPTISVAMIGFFAVYSIAGTHDYFAASRAQVKAIAMLESAGVPRTSIQAGFPSDGWVQIQNGGHINESRLQVPPGAYDPHPAILGRIPDGCADGFTRFTPVIDPKYFVVFPWFKDPVDPVPPWCFVPAGFPAIPYAIWLPPFHETMVVNKLAPDAWEQSLASK